MLCIVYGVIMCRLLVAGNIKALSEEGSVCAHRGIRCVFQCRVVQRQVLPEATSLPYTLTYLPQCTYCGSNLHATVWL